MSAALSAHRYTPHEVPGGAVRECAKAAILVVEEDPTIAKFLTVMVRDDFQALVATTGQEALDLARRERPAVITLDLMLPYIPGRIILEALKGDQATAHIPAIVMSAFTRNLGATDRSRAARIVAKPFRPIELLEAVRDVATSES